jgi:hypothetical protein
MGANELKAEGINRMQGLKFSTWVPPVVGLGSKLLDFVGVDVIVKGHEHILI